MATGAFELARLPRPGRVWQKPTARLLVALAPALVLLAVFYFYPLANVLVLSVSDPQLGTQNFEWFFNQEVNVIVLLRTIGTSISVTLICVVMAYPFAFFMTIVGTKTRAILLIVVLIPFWTSTVIRTFAWVILLQDSGPVGDLLRLVGVERMGIMRTNTAVLIGMAQVLLPFVVLPMYANMSKIDIRLITAARSLGARPVKSFVQIYLPLSLPGLVAGGLLCFVLALGFYITPAMLGSSKESLLSTQIQGQLQGQLEWGHGAAMALILLLVTVFILGVAALLGRRTNTKVSSMVGGSKA